MKRILISMVILLTGLLLMAPVAGAYSVSVGDTIKLDYGIGNANGGGAFTVYVDDYPYFNTFCLERNEFFTPGGSVYVGGITDKAKLGGLTGGPSDPLSTESAYLFYKWYHWNYAHTRTIANALQLAIWELEGEITTEKPLTLNELALDFIAEAVQNANGSLYDVRVMNLYGSYSQARGYYNNKQDMLIAPEPTTILLLGSGLLGLALYRRKNS